MVPQAFVWPRGGIVSLKASDSTAWGNAPGVLVCRGCECRRFRVIYACSAWAWEDHEAAGVSELRQTNHHTGEGFGWRVNHANLACSDMWFAACWLVQEGVEFLLRG